MWLCACVNIIKKGKWQKGITHFKIVLVLYILYAFFAFPAIIFSAFAICIYLYFFCFFSGFFFFFCCVQSFVATHSKTTVRKSNSKIVLELQIANMNAKYGTKSVRTGKRMERKRKTNLTAKKTKQHQKNGQGNVNNRNNG